MSGHLSHETVAALGHNISERPRCKIYSIHLYIEILPTELRWRVHYRNYNIPSLIGHRIACNKMNPHQVLLLTDNIDAMAVWLSELHQVEKPYLITLAPLDPTVNSQVADYDVIIIQADASTMSDAVEIFKHLYGMTEAPLLFISSVDDEARIVEVYEAGVDEYIVMPINLFLFHAKLVAWLRWRIPVDSRSSSQQKITWRAYRRPDRDS